MKIKDIWGNTLFSLETVKTIAELVLAAVSAKKNLYGANLSRANLYGANLYEANLTRANLYEANLTRASLTRANLTRANLDGANLTRANLDGANLTRANLDGANLYGANLYGANLYGANLSGANLYGANLYGANLYGANLDGANLYGANLDGANLDGASLDGAINIPTLALAQLQFIPDSGAFIGWKKCANNTIVKLGISASAQRSHSTGRKCRCSKAKTLAIYAQNGTELQKTSSLYDSSFVYCKGKIVVPNGFDTDRWHECGKGIHFFITRVEAENFNF